MPKKKTDVPAIISPLNDALEKLDSNTELAPAEFDEILKELSRQFKAGTSVDASISPTTYVAQVLGVSPSSINSYVFTSQGIFYKDVEENVKPYVAFTTALIHALTLGAYLGKHRAKNVFKEVIGPSENETPKAEEGVIAN